MAADHLVSLVNAHLGSRSVRSAAQDADVLYHHIARYLRPGYVLRSMPSDERIADIAKVIGTRPEQVREALALDLRGVPAPVDDQHTRELMHLYDGLSAPYRATLLQMARSLSHLERSVSQDGMPESGDPGVAV